MKNRLCLGSIELSRLAALLLSCLSLALCSCDRKKEAGNKAGVDTVPVVKTNTAEVKVTEAVRERLAPCSPRTYEEIKRSGELRVLSVMRDSGVELQRLESLHERQLRLLSAFAEWLGVELKVIYLESFDQLIPELIRGRGDLISANMAITASRRRQIDFSLPVAMVKEHLVSGIASEFKNLKELSGRTITIRGGTSYWESVNELRRNYPEIKVANVHADTEELLYQTGTGRIEYTVADDDIIRKYQSYRDDIKIIHTFPAERVVAFGLNKGNAGLKHLLDSFVRRELPFYRGEEFKGDLPELKRRKLLRVLTRDNPVNYFIHRGVLMGFEYELARKFAKEHGMRLVMVVPPEWSQMRKWLLEGRGDIIAASLTVTPKRLDDGKVSFCAPYTEVREVIAARKSDGDLKSVADLASRTFAVRLASNYCDTLMAMRRKGIKLKMRAVPNDMETSEILLKVAEGEFDLTLTDDIFLKIHNQLRDDLKVLSQVGVPKRYAWAVRSENPELKRAVDEFMTREYKGEFYNTLYHKYIDGRRLERVGTVSASIPFDELIRKHANANDLSWYLVAAQIYKESTFNPNAESYLGARGLMQLMPATALEMDCSNPFHPESNIKAGCAYLGKLKGRFVNADDFERACFALAGYNGGIGHVFDARKLALEKGLNPGIWKGNVELAMRKLSMPRYSSRSRYGACQGDEIAEYVNSILNVKSHYRQEIESRKNKHGPTAK